MCMSADFQIVNTINFERIDRLDWPLLHSISVQVHQPVILDKNSKSQNIQKIFETAFYFKNSMYAYSQYSKRRTIYLCLHFSFPTVKLTFHGFKERMTEARMTRYQNSDNVQEFFQVLEESEFCKAKFEDGEDFVLMIEKKK